jgi:hypothetical protein
MQKKHYIKHRAAYILCLKIIITFKAWHQEVSLRAKVGVEAKEGAIASGRLG